MHETNARKRKLSIPQWFDKLPHSGEFERIQKRALRIVLPALDSYEDALQSTGLQRLSHGRDGLSDKLFEEIVTDDSHETKLLRGDFLENRVFFIKCAQNLATRPSSKICFAAILVLNFLSNLRKETKFHWVVANVEKAKHCK